MNKKAEALSTEQHKEIAQTKREGFCVCKLNKRIATALVLAGTQAMRASALTASASDTLPSSTRAAATAQRYIGMEPERTERAIECHVQLMQK